MQRMCLLLTVGAVAFCWQPAPGQPDLKNVALPTGLVADKTPASAAGVVSFLEGPAADVAGNDFFIDTKGRVWFTDPYYGPDRSQLEMDVEGVYRIDPDGKVTRVLTQKELHRPNGIAITPDAKTLYVIDSHPNPGGNRKIWAFD